MPLSGGKRLVDVEKVRDYLDDIRANLPGELRQAQADRERAGPRSWTRRKAQAQGQS